MKQHNNISLWEKYRGWTVRAVLVVTLSCLACMDIHAGSSALFISDSRQISESWQWIFTPELGLDLTHVSECYGCRLKADRGVSDDVARILSDRNTGTQKPAVILLQLGCNDSADTDASTDTYAHTLFDFPFGKVCNNKGANVKNKNIAISKDITRISCSNFSGALCRIVNHLREVTPDSRIFILPPIRYCGNPSAEDLKKAEQVRQVAQLFCIPYVGDAGVLDKYRFVWKNQRPDLGKVLLIGDSYCFTRKWTGEFEKIAKVSITNLGKTSATLKERKGNSNTLGAQLLRIPSGCNPDVIILEGGINDEADQPKVVENYPEHIANLRRTNFAGALAYLVKVLRGRFPHARIYAVTPGGLYYGHTDRPFDFIVKSEQIRRAASLIGIPTIDWDREGRLSFVFNNSKGTGNGSDSTPFIYNVPSLETGDLLHPNERGGRYLAENVVAELNRQVLKKPSAE